METAFYKSSIGLLEIKGSESGITSVNFIDATATAAAAATAAAMTSSLTDCVKQLDEYFNGKRKSFDLKFDLSGTDFQKKVWIELLKIPFGKTCSYIDLAKKLGNKMSLRAVGNANGKNPVSIIIPCHRVIGSNGKLIGFGGGLWRKKWLLDFEKNTTQGNLFASS